MKKVYLQIILLSLLLFFNACGSSEEGFKVKVFIPYRITFDDSLIVNKLNEENISYFFLNGLISGDDLDSSTIDEIQIYIADEISASSFLNGKNNERLTHNLSNISLDSADGYIVIPISLNPILLYSNKNLSGNDSINNLSDLLTFCQNFESSNGTYPFGVCYGDQGREYYKVIPLLQLDNISSNFPIIFSNENYNSLLAYSDLSRYSLIETERYIRNSFLNNKLAYCLDDLTLYSKYLRLESSFSVGVSVFPGSQKAIFARKFYLITKNYQNIDIGKVLKPLLKEEIIEKLLKSHPELGIPIINSKDILYSEDLKEFVSINIDNYTFYSLPHDALTQNYCRILEEMSDKTILSEESPWQALQNADNQFISQKIISHGAKNQIKQHN